MSNISPIPHLLRAAVSIFLLATLCVGGVWGQKTKQDTLDEKKRLTTEIANLEAEIKANQVALTTAEAEKKTACKDGADQTPECLSISSKIADITKKMEENKSKRQKFQNNLNALKPKPKSDSHPIKGAPTGMIPKSTSIAPAHRYYIKDLVAMYERGQAENSKDSGWLPALLALTIGAGIFGLVVWWLPAKYITPELEKIKAAYDRNLDQFGKDFAASQSAKGDNLQVAPQTWYAHGFRDGRFIPNNDKSGAWFEIVPNPYDSEKATYKLLPGQENIIDQNWADVQGAFMVSGNLRNYEYQPLMVDYNEGTLRRDGDGWAPVNKIRIRRGKEEQREEIILQKTILFAAPPANGQFVHTEMSAQRASDDFVFEIEMDGKNPSRAKIRFINDTGVYLQIKKLLRERVDFACQIMAESARTQDVEPVEDGVLIKEGGIWKVERKIKIKIKA